MNTRLNVTPKRLLASLVAVLPVIFSAACGQATVPEPQPTGAVQSQVTPAEATEATDATEATQVLARPSLLGELDPSFGTGGKVTTDLGSTLDEAHDVVVQKDGKIVVLGGTWPKGERGSKFALLRYDAKGNLDKTFGDGGKIIENVTEKDNDASEAHALALQPDGKIIAVGSTYGANYNQQLFVVMRYKGDGSLDEDFGEGGKVLTPIDIAEDSQSGDVANAVALTPEGKIVVAGMTGRYPTDFATVRYNPDGSLDETFGDGGRVITDFPAEAVGRAVAVQPDGKVLVAGYASMKSGKEYQDFTLVRYNKDGTPDETFGEKGIVMTDFADAQDWAYAIALQPNGKITLAGPAEIDARICGAYVCPVFGFGLAQYNSDGSLDTKFGHAGKISYKLGVSDASYDLIRLPNGKLLTAGHISNNNFGLAMLNADGSLDTTFGNKGWVNTSFGKYTDRANAIALQPDGKVVAVGVGVVDPDDILNGDFALARYR